MTRQTRSTMPGGGIIHRVVRPTNHRIIRGSGMQHVMAQAALEHALERPLYKPIYKLR